MDHKKQRLTKEGVNSRKSRHSSVRKERKTLTSASWGKERAPDYQKESSNRRLTAWPHPRGRCQGGTSRVFFSQAGKEKRLAGDRNSRAFSGRVYSFGVSAQTMRAVWLPSDSLGKRKVSEAEQLEWGVGGCFFVKRQMGEGYRTGPEVTRTSGGSSKGGEGRERNQEQIHRAL